MTTGRRFDPLPFLRRGQSERLRKGRRKRTLRRVLTLVIGLWGIGMLGGAAYTGRQYLTHSPHFDLTHVEIAPTRHAPRKELYRVVRRSVGKNVFRIDLGRIADDLERVPWVRSAAVKRILPDRIHCTIEERMPRGMARLDDRSWLVDEDGVAIDTLGEKTTMYSFPIFTGIDDANQERSKKQIRRGVALLRYLNDAAQGLTTQISQIDLRRDDRIGLHMADGGPEVRLNPVDFGSNLERYLTMRDYLATHFGDGAYVDLRFRDSISFQPAISRKR